MDRANPPAFVDVKDAARLAGVSVDKIRSAIRRDLLHPVDLNGRSHLATAELMHVKHRLEQPRWD